MQSLPSGEVRIHATAYREPSQLYDGELVWANALVCPDCWYSLMSTNLHDPAKDATTSHQGRYIAGHCECRHYQVNVEMTPFWKRRKITENGYDRMVPPSVVYDERTIYPKTANKEAC